MESNSDASVAFNNPTHPIVDDSNRDWRSKSNERKVEPSLETIQTFCHLKGAPILSSYNSLEKISESCNNRTQVEVYELFFQNQVEAFIYEGYNASIISFDQFEDSLLGPIVLSSTPLQKKLYNLLEAVRNYGFCGGFLCEFFNKNQLISSKYTIGISSWLEYPSLPSIDLLDEDSNGLQPKTFISQYIPNLKAAFEILDRSKEQIISKPQIDTIACWTVRLVLHNSEDNQVSSLHFLQLDMTKENSILCCIETSLHNTLESISSDRTGQQNFISNENQLDGQDDYGEFSQFIATLMCGNSKTYIYLQLDSSVESNSTTELEKALCRISSMARTVPCTCMKIKNVQLEDLAFKGSEHIESTENIFQNKKQLENEINSRLSSASLESIQNSREWLKEFHLKKSRILGSRKGLEDYNGHCSSVHPVTKIISDKEKKELFKDIQKCSQTMTDDCIQTSNANEGNLEAVKMANLPTCPPIVPNVEGLDPQMAISVKIAEANLLRQNYAALLSVVKEQQHLQDCAKERIAEFEHTLLESKTENEIKLENMRLENVELRSRLRKVENESDFKSLFLQYESDITKVRKEVEELRSRNIELELNRSVRGSSDLKKRYKYLSSKYEKLFDEVEKLRKKERHFQVNQRLIEDSSQRVKDLSQQVTHQTDELLDSKLRRVQLTAQVDLAKAEVESTQQQYRALKCKEVEANEELVAMKMYMATIEKEKKNASILGDFVAKHGAKLTSTNSSFFQPSRMKNSTAIEKALAQLKLIAKRSLPHLVPKLNQLEKHYLEQESLILDYSARETDFIKLLMEFASEQSVYSSLKSQIHTELSNIN